MGKEKENMRLVGVLFVVGWFSYCFLSHRFGLLEFFSEVHLQRLCLQNINGSWSASDSYRVISSVAGLCGSLYLEQIFLYVPKLAVPELN